MNQVLPCAVFPQVRWFELASVDATGATRVVQLSADQIDAMREHLAEGCDGCQAAYDAGMKALQAVGDA